MIDELTRAVDQTVRAADPDEFAFLALTSKVELPFRDRLAYALATSAAPRGERVAREWKRCDLAWLSDSGPKLLVEVKACYTFDLVIQPDVFLGYLRADLLKSRNLVGSGPACFAVLLATHPSGEIPAPLFDTIKYASGVNGAISRFGGVDQVCTRAVAEAEGKLRGFSSVKSFRMELGSYLGIGAVVLGWILGEPVAAAA
jgi:hypothetical protein